MKLNPPGSSSDLDAARDIARRLSQSAYGKRTAARRFDASALTRPVEAAGDPLAPPARSLHVEAPPPRPVEAEPPPPAPAVEAIAPHAEPPLEAPPAEVVAAEPPPVEPPPPPPAEPEVALASEPPAEQRTDSGSFTIHRPSGRSRVDALLEQALGRAAALPAATHRHEPTHHEPFVPIPTPVPDRHVEQETPPAPEPHAEPPLAEEHGELTNPSLRAPEADAPIEAPSVEEPRVEEPAASPFEAEAPSQDNAFGGEEAPAPVEAPAGVFDPTALVGAGEPLAEPADEFPIDAAPVLPPSWPDVLDRCLRIATDARGVLIAGADGRLIASAGHWPAKAEAIASKLVPLIQKAPRSATEEPLPIKLGPNVLTSWQFREDGELLTAAFVGDVAVAPGVWPELKERLRRLPS